METTLIELIDRYKSDPESVYSRMGSVARG